ncbi:hypothetical protein E3N88_29895 [Mikania micrantha]|uniref:Uncharacterized protein n=1 Tax=Mikania micrantha TaxID=192012 RepID=A0A5N6MKV2_9ASTR|nr:hypothetical protein E3N88_29895 [Mikania micrantha]
MKEHLGCTHKDVAPCDKVPPEVKEEILHYLKQFQENKVASQRNFEESVGSGAYYSGDGSVNPSSSSRGVRGPMDRFMGSARDNEDGSLPNEKMTPASAKEHRNRIEDQLIAYKEKKGLFGFRGSGASEKRGVGPNEEVGGCSSSRKRKQVQINLIDEDDDIEVNSVEEKDDEDEDELDSDAFYAV